MPEFSAAQMETVQALLGQYPDGRQKSAILPLLHMAQQSFGGYLSVDTMTYIATLVGMSPVEVYEVATFYTMFHLTPVGTYVLEVCRTGPCALAGAEDTIERIEAVLGIKDGETTPDGMFTLKTVECLASCGTAPVIQVGERYIEQVTPDRVPALIDQLRAGGRP